GDSERALWREHAQRLWNGRGAIVRVSWLPINIDAVVAQRTHVAQPFRAAGGAGTAAGGAGTAAGGAGTVRLKPDTTYADDAHGVDLVGRAAVGAGLVRIDGDDDAQARAIEALRASTVLGHVVIVRGSDALRSRIDVWGSHGDRQRLFDALKRTFDPHNVL